MEIKCIAMPEKDDKELTYFSANYLQRSCRLEKGESSTTHPISWLVSAYINAVTAPILLPQIPILLTVPKERKYSNTVWTSPLS